MRSGALFTVFKNAPPPFVFFYGYNVRAFIILDKKENALVDTENKKLQRFYAGSIGTRACNKRELALCRNANYR